MNNSFKQDKNLSTSLFDSNAFSREIAKALANRSIDKKKFKSVSKFPLIAGKQALYIMDWQKSKISYSKSIPKMFGYTKDEFNMTMALNNIHPEDKKIVNRVIRGVINQSINTNLSAGNQYLILTYRAQKKDGKYIKILHQSWPYQLDDKGNFISNLTFLTDISFMKTNDNKVEWDILSDNIDVSLFKETIYKEFMNFFTKRELAVISLIQNHFTNKQIADQLFISVHTVVSHRKNILKKSICHNAKELIEFCKLNGII